MNSSKLLENQLLVTKFYVPVASGTLISRPRLTSLLDESLKYPLTLVSAPAGFGKTTLLASWSQSLPASSPRVAWVSLDEEDNEPRLFWTCVLTALSRQLPEYFTLLLAQLQSPQVSSLKHILTALINLLVESTDHLLLILDDYQVISEQQVHTTLAYLIEHLPPQLRIVLVTRADPPLPLPLLRVHQQAFEVRTDQLRCTVEETAAFFKEITDIQLPDETIQEIIARTEGWLVGLQLLGLSLPAHTDSLTILKELRGDQRYILDYLTEVVLQQQPQEIQAFLLSTCILERLTVSLCDTVMEQSGSQQMFQRLEQANLFVVSLDNKRQSYRYHALFAQALCYHLEQLRPHQVPLLHLRASRWYAQHNQTTEAITHALRAKEWSWAADLVQQKLFPLMSYTWGASKHELITIKEWLLQLPADVMYSRPQLCLASALLARQVVSDSLLKDWLDVAEAMLSTQTDENDPSTTMIQKDLLGGVLGLRAGLKLYEGDGQVVLAACQRSFTLFSPDNLVARANNLIIQAKGYAFTSMNDAVTAVETGLQAIALSQSTGQSSLIIFTMATIASLMRGAGQLHHAYRLTQQAIELNKRSRDSILPEVSRAITLQALALCEWNKLDEALALVQEAVSLSQQGESRLSLIYIACGYAALLHIALSCRDLKMAQRALQEFEAIGMQLNQSLYLDVSSDLFTIDRARCWLACGELDRAARWVEELGLTERHSNPFFCEQEEVACAYVLLARAQPALALQRLEPVLQRATTGQRWGHVIEARLLQALAHQMLQEEVQALQVLSEAVRLAEPEGYIRSFVDKEAAMEALLYQLRKRERKGGSTLYLDTVLAAFQQERKANVQEREPTKAQLLPGPLSERELEILQLLARGTSNLEIAQELVIAVNTVKRHVNHIFSKLGVHNRTQAALQARELGLLSEEV